MQNNSPKKDEVNKEKLKEKLTPLQYSVTQDKVTERPFSGKYLKLKDNGVYACVVCGIDLFSSCTKYDSGCGWPSFWDVLDENKVKYATDISHVAGNLLLLALKPDLARTEVSCSHCGAHLGHFFDDGPKPTGKRFCINSAALDFQKGEKADAKDEKIEPKPVVTEVKVPVVESKVACKPSVTPLRCKVTQV